MLDIDPYASKPAHFFSPADTAEIRILPDPSAFNQPKNTKTRNLPIKAFELEYFEKPIKFQKLTAKPIRLLDSESFEDLFQDDYVDLNRFFKNKGVWSQGNSKWW